MGKKKEDLTIETHGPVAAAPERAYVKTTLVLGLASFDVEFLTGTTSSRVSRSQFVEIESDGKTEFHPVGVKPYDKVTEADVDKSAIIKGVAHGDQVVVITDEELSSFGLERGASPITGFIKRQNLDERWLVPSAIYQARPAHKRVGKENRPNVVAQKLYSLLLGSLERNDCVALLPLTLRDGGAKRYGLLDHHGRLSIMHYAEELRLEVPLTLVSSTAEEDALIDEMVASHELGCVPMLHDETGANLRDLIDRKLAGEVTNGVVTPVTQTAEEQDVAALLRASLGK
jgi:non-homologous end joining protein Ku